MSLRNFTAALTFVCCLVLPNAHAAPSSTDLAKIRSEIEQIREKNHATEVNRDKAADALKQSEHAISNANRSLSELDQQRNETERMLSQLHNQSIETHKSIDQQQKALESLIRQQYFAGQSDAAKLLMNGGNPNQIARNLTYFSYISRARNQLIKALQKNLDQLDQVTQSQQQEQARLDQIRQDHQQQREVLQKQRQAKQQVITQLGSEIKKQNQQLATLIQNEKRITKLMQDIAKAQAIAKRKAEQAAKKARKTRKSTPSNPKTTPLSQPNTPDTGLGRLKGHLPLPTQGELIHRFGTPREQGGSLWKGLFIKAPAGQAVHSVANGEVVFSDWLRGFGNLIIVDHGGGYMSLYSNNETLYKQVGSSVKAGDTIASVGNTGGNEETGLYFELRYRSQAFDPGSWIAR